MLGGALIIFAVGSIIGLGYSLLVWGLLRHWHAGLASATARTLRIGIPSFILGLVVYLIIGEGMRYQPERLALEGRGWTILVLWYGTALLLTAGIGSAIGHRLDEDPVRVAMIAVLALLVFMALILPWTEFTSLCLTDVTLILRPSC